MRLNFITFLLLEYIEKFEIENGNGEYVTLNRQKPDQNAENR